jgi:hypothetical protein
MITPAETVPSRECIERHVAEPHAMCHTRGGMSARSIACAVVALLTAPSTE